MAKVSVILPSLNVGKYIGQCLESVVNQTLKDIEIICVDAGSTDGTLETINEYVERDSRVKLIISDKKSYGYQMNLGISAATGTYIGIVETDDFVSENMYEDLYKAAVENQAEIVKADFYGFYTSGDVYKRVYRHLDPTVTYYNRVICPAEHLQVFRLIMNTWSGIYLRSFITENNIKHNESPGASFQDVGFWFQTFCCAKRVFFVNKPYYMYRKDNADSSVKNPGKVYCMTEEYDYIYRWLKCDKERFQTFIGIYPLHKYKSLLFTYGRIAPELRADFAMHMGSELGKHIAAGEYKKNEFMLHEWRKLNLIVNAPKEYHRMRTYNCSYITTCDLCDRFSRHRSLVKVIKFADKAVYKAELALSYLSYYGVVRGLRAVKNMMKQDSRKVL